MKKFLLSFSLLAGVCAISHAQILFSEDFDGLPGPTAGGAGTYVFPNGWFLRNVDNGTPATSVSYVNDAWERREDFGFNVADSAAFSTSWYSPAGTADDWMWTPLIGPLPANSVLTWSARAYDPSYSDGYEVRIMTAAQGPPTGGTGVIGNQITNSTVLFSVAAENTTWTQHSVNLNAYAGQSVYISWRNHSTDKFLLVVDNVVVQVQVNIDAQMLFADTATQYTQIPQPQGAPLNFNGTIRNNGINTLSNVSAQVNVFNGATNVYSASSTPTASLASTASASWTVAPFTPTAVGNYTVQFIANQTSGTDQVPANDTLYQYFTVTDTTYARDDGMVTGSLGIGAGNGGYLGQDYDLVTSDTLTSVSMYVTRGYTGKMAGIAIWNMASGTPTTIAAVTDTILYPDDSARFYTIPIYGGGIVLSPGKYAVTAIEFDSTLALGQTNTVFTTNTTWVNWPTSPLGGWGNNEDFGSSFAKSYVIRPNFGNICADNMATATATTATCLTCADGSASVTATGTNGPLTYSWSPSGGTGATASNIPTGIYTVTVTDGFGCVSTAMVSVAYDTCSSFNAILDSTAASCGTCADGIASATPVNNMGPVTYLWSTGDTTSTVTGLLPGTYTVTITDSLGCTYTDSLHIGFSTVITDLASQGKISVYPNPNDGQFVLNIDLDHTADVKVVVVDMLGQEIMNNEYSGVTSRRIDINLGDDAVGLYTIRVLTKDATWVVPVNVR
ncbi:MAG TPA: choice-of-anchor J domain-containing protein [Bacteroidia bacterium]|nr:choice-of-anchor J domain-containing protein [Bacteroidia bacterium]